jgi:predicted small lipoprotein YifL
MGVPTALGNSLCAVALLVSLAGCGGAASPGPYPAAETTASGKCIQSFETYSVALRDDPGIDEGKFQQTTIDRCSHEEWLAAATDYTAGPNCIVCANPEAVLWAFCEGKQSSGHACEGVSKERPPLALD